MIDLDFIDIFIAFMGFMLPASLFWAALYFKKELKSTILISLAMALVTGTVLQSPFESHPHVPGSGFIVIVLVVVFTMAAIVLSLVLRHVYGKVKNT